MSCVITQSRPPKLQKFRDDHVLMTPEISDTDWFLIVRRLAYRHQATLSSSINTQARQSRRISHHVLCCVLNM